MKMFCPYLSDLFVPEVNPGIYVSSDVLPMS